MATICGDLCVQCSSHPLCIAAGARHYDLMAFGNGTLAGLVAITSPCSTVYPWAAIIIGGVSGVLYCIGSEVRLD